MTSCHMDQIILKMSKVNLIIIYIKSIVILKDSKEVIVHKLDLILDQFHIETSVSISKITTQSIQVLM